MEPTPNTGTPKVACNAIRVFQGRAVPFGFAKAGGIPEGSTGNLVSVACKGSCGTVAPNPMDVAVVADRTRSMSSNDVNEMVDGIRGMLREMTRDPAVRLAGGDRPQRAHDGLPVRQLRQRGADLSRAPTGTSGRWLPISFSDDYVDGGGNLRRLERAGQGPRSASSSSPTRAQGTSLAAPMKAASRYLLGWDANNLASMPQRDNPATKVMIFETDGQPNETEPTGGTTSLNSAGDVFSNRNDTAPPVTTTQSDSTSASGGVTTVTHRRTVTHTYIGGAQACANLINVAQQAKAQGILVIVIAYNLTGKKCNDYDGGNPSSTSTSSSQTVDGPEPVVKNAWGQVVKKYQTTTTTVKTKSALTSSVLDVMATAASPANGRALDGEQRLLDDRPASGGELRRRLPLLRGHRHRHGADLQDGAVAGLEGDQAAPDAAVAAPEPRRGRASGRPGEQPRASRR